MKRYGKGWYGESYRHYLASKGFLTKKSVSVSSPEFRRHEALAKALLEEEEHTTLSPQRIGEIRGKVLKKWVAEDQADSSGEDGVKVKFTDKPIWPWKSDEPLKVKVPETLPGERALFDTATPTYDPNVDWVKDTKVLLEKVKSSEPAKRLKELAVSGVEDVKAERLAMQRKELEEEATDIGRSLDEAYKETDPALRTAKFRDIQVRKDALNEDDRALRNSEFELIAGISQRYPGVSNLESGREARLAVMSAAESAAQQAEEAQVAKNRQEFLEALRRR